MSEIYHHGILGQKWGVRRYQNPDGSLTPAGKRRQDKNMASDKKSNIQKGTTLYRISDQSGSDTSGDKIYVNANKEGGDFFITTFGANKIYNKGKAYVQEYEATNDIKLPNRKTMEKIELSLLKDLDVRTELIDSLMEKGMSRDAANKQVRAYSAGKAFCEKAGVTAWSSLMLGAYAGTVTLNPAVGLGTAAVSGAGIGTMMMRTPSDERMRALNAARMSYGDKNNVVTNAKLRDALAKKGYNAMKDYNDRRAYGKEGNQAMIVFDSKNNMKLTKAKELDSSTFAKAYADDYKRRNKKDQSSYSSLIKEGEKKYKSYYENGVIERERQKEREEEKQRLLDKAKS